MLLFLGVDMWQFSELCRAIWCFFLSFDCVNFVLKISEFRIYCLTDGFSPCSIRQDVYICGRI